MIKLFVSLIATLLFSTLPTSTVIEKPLRAPHIIHVQSIDQNSVKVFAREMDYAHSTGQDVIPIVISSYGGSVYAVLEMIDIIKASKLPVATIASGKAMSAGAVLLACGDEGLRFAAPGATIMLHEVSAMVGGSAQSIRMNAAEVGRLNQKLFHLVAESTGHPDDYFLKIIHAKGHSEWYFDAKEAKKHNIVNHIGLPTLETRIIIKSSLKLIQKKKAEESRRERRKRERKERKEAKLNEEKK